MTKTRIARVIGAIHQAKRAGMTLAEAAGRTDNYFLNDTTKVLRDNMDTAITLWPFITDHKR